MRTERTYVKEQLADLGISAQGEANYLSFELDDNGKLTNRMKQRGILIRDCSNYPGLGPGSYRIAIRTRPENEQLIAALAEALQEA